MTSGPPRVAILAGGRSTRFVSQDGVPKALAVVDGRALIDRVIDRYVAAGHRHVVIALGHHADVIRTHLGQRGRVRGDLVCRADGTTLQLVDTGTQADTGGRVAAISPLLASTFHLAWCDGLVDVDIRELERHHVASSALTTMVVAHPPTRFGRVWVDGDEVTRVEEKPVLDDVWVSAGMFVVDQAALVHATEPASSWERDVLPRLAKHGDLSAYRHDGFWAAVDTMDDLDRLREVLASAEHGSSVDPHQ